jgi:RNA polymerase sigma factor (sigma-70 family)
LCVSLADLDFSALYQRYAKDVYRFALYLSGNEAQAEDITAETFARAWTARDTIRVDTVKAYLIVIARNLYRDSQRTGSTEQWNGERDLPDSAPDPETAASARQELAAVLRTLRLIPELDRTLLLMAAVERLPYDTIAAAMAMSVGAVKVRVHRARVKLNALRSNGEIQS